MRGVENDNFRVAEGGGLQSCMGGRGQSNTEGTTYMLIVTDVTLGTVPNVPLAYSMVLKLQHPVVSKLRYFGGRLEIQKRGINIKHIVQLIITKGLKNYIFLPSVAAEAGGVCAYNRT